jgi:pyruvate kinase
MHVFHHKTKIVATVGPACDTKEKILELTMAGVDVFRLNFSHGTHEGHLKVMQYIREINETFNYNLAILQDLQGPKIRIGKLSADFFEIEKGEKITITTNNILGTKEKISCSYANFVNDLKTGDKILIDDGKIELRALTLKKDEVICEVIFGGKIKPNKGINLPQSKISAPSLTEKDHEDLLFGLEQGVDWIALSFVRTAQDMINLKSLIEEKGKKTKVIAKIERPEAIKNIDSIIKYSDALMVARGDLGVEMEMEEIPMLQKKIVQKCNRAAKPVIIATQMMESMIENPRPTRAETADVANAVLDGADALMLSGETAAGKHPVAVIKSMTQSIQSVERASEDIYYKTYKLSSRTKEDLSRSIVATACRLADRIGAKAITGMTYSGKTAFLIARHRPKAQIFIFTKNRNLLNTLALVWGVRGFYYDGFVSTDATFEDIKKSLAAKGYLQKDDLIISTASMPIIKKGTTNMLKLSIID